MPDKTIQVIPPRIVHNKNLFDKFMAEHKIAFERPPVADQLPTFKVDVRGYNPSIIRWNGKLLMSYRYHHDGTLSTRLALAELDETFKVVENHNLELNDESLSQEDARLFIHDGKLFMSYVASEWPRFPSATVKYVELTKPDHWRSTLPIEHPYKDRQTLEKNHLPFPQADGLKIIYKSGVIFKVDSRDEWLSTPDHWPYGEIRGGTVPMPYGDKLIRFFHSSLKNEMPPLRARYYCGALLMSPVPPFQTLAISSRPILYGSEVGGDDTQRQFKKAVVIPYGAIEHDGGWIISTGINDSECRLVVVKPENLNL